MARSKKPSRLAIEIAVRIWMDPEMYNITVDVKAVEAIAKILDKVRRSQANARSCRSVNTHRLLVDCRRS